LSYLLIQTYVIDLRFSSVFALQYTHPLSCDYLCYRVIGVQDVSDHPGSERTCLHACGFQALCYPVITEIAFLSRVVFRVEKPDPVWARHNAVPAADAPGPVYQNYAVRGLICGAYRTYLHAGRVLALVAEFGYKVCFLYVIILDVLIVP